MRYNYLTGCVMTTVQFGNSGSYATVLFDRDSKVCVLVANTDEHLSDALVVATSMKPDEIIIVLPLTVVVSGNLVPSEVYSVYKLKK